ncbi:ABC transporter ATP-binding protein [uncultured Roseobacter sp.]|uniref:ABC transporter transmembrane domain-containing protein n=1 Tax=uncultured Roseobacter sp. TaxID=114847 RepID=UPI00261C39B5|nr:ABC transporter ATP-binding protein [uncultured Roseobacter sp.]
MNKLPKILASDRILDAVALPLLSVGQAVFLGIGVFATREAFGALHEGVQLQNMTLCKLAGSGILAVGLEFLRRICAERLGQSYASSLRLGLYRHLAGMQKSELDARRLGALSLRFVGDLSAARNWFGWGLPRVVSAAIVLPGALLVLWLLDSGIALTSSVVLGLALLFMAAVAIGFERLHLRLRSRRARIAIAMMERISIAPLLDLMGRTEQELKALEESGQQLREEATARARRAGALSAIPQLGLTTAGALALWQAAQSSTAPGTVAAIVSMLGVLALPLRDLAMSWDQYNGWRIAKGKALRLFDKPSRLREQASAIGPVGVTVSGILDGKCVSLSVPAGSIGLLQGGNARSRSILAMLIAGLDTDADLKIDYGTGTAVLPRIHFIGDTPVALQGSLRRTLTLGISPRPAGKSIARIARAFGLGELLPQGRKSLRGRVAEAARNLSTADSLRIDLARIALAKPDLVIIDTSRFAADPECEKLLKLLSDHVESTIVVVDRRASDDQSFSFRANPTRPAAGQDLSSDQAF